MTQKELTELLIKASEAYYNGDEPLMSDLEFDRKVEELKALEAASGTVYPGSPTQNVGAAGKVDGLKKVTHEQPALSLDKVKYKDRLDLEKWLGDKEGVVSWKMDGLTLVLTYDNGKLTQAVTRGDGVEGNDVTHNARYFKGIPETIEYKGHLVVRGEAVMTYKEFERVNAEAGGIYENPRNLAAATVQMLDPNESKKREIEFFAFELVEPAPQAKILSIDFPLPFPTEGEEVKRVKSSFNISLFKERMGMLGALDFQTVPIGFGVTADIVDEVIGRWEEQLHEGLQFPTDGLVFTYDDLLYGWGLGSTGHHPRWAIALKWTDETAETVIRDIEWSVGKTGVITPVAVFNPVRLGAGSTITRASLHNVSILKNMPTQGSCLSKEPVRIGCKAWIYLSNMIIPQVARIQNILDGGKTLTTKDVEIPDKCPVCGAPTELRRNGDTAVLYCTGRNCSAKTLASLMNTFGKDGLNVKGLGESQIEDLMEAGLVTADVISFYRLQKAYDEFIASPKGNEPGPEYFRYSKFLMKDGWGKKKWDNLMAAIRSSRNVTLQKFLYSLNIPMLGNDLSKKLSKYWDGDVNELIRFMEDVRDNGTDWGLGKLMALDGIGDEKARSVISWMEETTAYREPYEEFRALVNELVFPAKKLPVLQRFINDLKIISVTPETAGALAKYWDDEIGSFTACIRGIKSSAERDRMAQQLLSAGNISSYAADQFSQWMYEVSTVYDNNGSNPVLETIDRLDELYKIIDELGITDIAALLGDFEPVDSEGRVLEGTIAYKGREYFCHINYMYSLSLEQEVAESILRQLNTAGESSTSATESVEGLIFVITGAVHDYKNRDEFKESVEARGGKVAGSVSAKTSFLVNNDVASTSGKNQKAKELNIPIISEDEFIARFGK